ncbi:hypothetical protein Tco_0174572 [Tanacetum coccineum]
MKEAMLPRVYHEFLLWDTSNKSAKTRYNTSLAQLLLKQIYSPYVVDWGLLNNMGCAEEIEEMLEIKVYQIGGQQEIFTSEAWRRLFDLNERIYTELCHGFYSTYDFDEVCADDELRTKKVIKFRLGGHGHTLTLLEFARPLGLYLFDETNDEGFEFITRIVKRMGLLTDEVLNSLSAPTYCKAPDATTLREMIDSNRRMGNMKIRQGTLERMARRQLYHTNRYAGLFEHMAGHYGYTLQGAYTPPRYDEEQQDED